MAALQSSSALQSSENLQCKSLPEPVTKAASFCALRNARHSCSLAFSSRLGSAEGNLQTGFLGSIAKTKFSSVGAIASSVEAAMESEMGVSYENLQKLLASCDWELADEETRRLIIVLAGENAVKRKYVFFSEVKFIPIADLATIDRLWRTHSNGKFGYSVQRKIMKRLDGDCTEFFKKVGWMKSLGSESPQFTYCCFPSEFSWELSPSSLEGHLPLTNALRGTQLLKCLLDHPAFEFVDDELQVSSVASSSLGVLTGHANASQLHLTQQKKPLSVNYSF